MDQPTQELHLGIRLDVAPPASALHPARKTPSRVIALSPMQSLALRRVESECDPGVQSGCPRGRRSA
jgi:hypothetical protein